MKIHTEHTNLLEGYIKGFPSGPLHYIRIPGDLLNDCFPQKDEAVNGPKADSKSLNSLEDSGNENDKAQVIERLENLLLDHLQKIWNRENSSFVMELIGTDSVNEIIGALFRNKNYDLMDKLKKSLIASAIQRQACIVSHGTDRGVMKYFGDEILRRRAMRFGMVSIGIVRWDAIDLEGFELFSSENRPIPMDRFIFDKHRRVRLNGGYTDFIFCDCENDQEIDFRIFIMNLISQKLETKKSPKSKAIPVVIICMGGDSNTETTLEKYHSIWAQDPSTMMPVILIEGFGGVTDKLAKELRASQNDSTEDGDTLVTLLNMHGMVSRLYLKANFFYLFFCLFRSK